MQKSNQSINKNKKKKKKKKEDDRSAGILTNLLQLIKKMITLIRYSQIIKVHFKKGLTQRIVY